jgi:hypothetical protein
MSVLNVRQACQVSALVERDDLVDQIANLEDLSEPKKLDAGEFFRRNHFTEGLRRLLQTGFARLNGKSDTGAFYLSQSMGGGKTHSLIAFGLLASNEALRQRIDPKLAATAQFGSAKIVVFNGHQNPRHFLWGHIAEQLGRPEKMARFWQNGADAPGVDDWIATIGAEPVLILLDELPSYLQMAAGRTVGGSTLADITIGALERLFNALPRLPKACVVVTNLKDDIYAQGSGKLRSLIDDLTKQYDKFATPIIPVQQNSAEVFQIIRTKLFDELPKDDVVEDLAHAYVDVLNSAKKIDSVASVPETFISRVRETYPFHPSIRDIAARFKENPGYQQTRALIRILRLAVRNAMSSSDNIFLIGLQHLDFNDIGTLEEVRKINPHFSNAISKDIADQGNSLAERIDANIEPPTASTTQSVAKLILMSSLSLAKEPLRGLRENEIVEYLINPLIKVSEIKQAIGELAGQCWYLFRGTDERIYFGQTANVTAEITDTARSLAEEVVDAELREKLKIVFAAKSGQLYDSDMAILPSLDEITTPEDKIRLVILERPSHDLPPAFIDWWTHHCERPNQILVLSVDHNAVGTLRAAARQMKAISIVEKAVLQRTGKDSSQFREVETIIGRAANQFTSAVRDAFKTVVFPVGKGHRAADLKMEFKDNNYDGEQQIKTVLAERGKFISSADIDKKFDTLRSYAQDDLFDADAVPVAELKRKAGARTSWYWLPPGGLDHLIKTCIARKLWREHGGLIYKAFERVTSVTARVESAGDAHARGTYILSLSSEEADTIYVSETGVPEPARSEKVSGRQYETAAASVWFLAVDSAGKAATGPAYQWHAPIDVKPTLTSSSSGVKLAVSVMPRSAVVLATFDGSPTREGREISTETSVPPGTQMIHLVGKVDERYSQEISITVQRPRRNGGDQPPAKPELQDSLPVFVNHTVESKSTPQAYEILEAIKAATGSLVKGGRIEVIGGSEQDFLAATFGDTIALDSETIETLLRTLAGKAGTVDPTVTLQINSIRFGTGRDFKNFADKLAIDFEKANWSQGPDV